MLIDRNDLTNSELEEMGLPLDDFNEPDDDFDDFDISALPFKCEWADELGVFAWQAPDRRFT